MSVSNTFLELFLVAEAIGVNDKNTSNDYYQLSQ